MKLLDQIRQVARVKHLAYRTEEEKAASRVRSPLDVVNT